MVRRNATVGPGRLRLWATTIIVAALAAVALPVQAHGTGIVQICERNNDPDCTSAVFAVCDPGVPQFTCSSQFNPDKGPRDVEIRVSNFPASTQVHLWWLKGTEPTDPRKTDCTQAVLQDRIYLGSVTTDGQGKAEKDETLPRPAWTNDNDWVYGPNWVCGTTADEGEVGTVGDRMFTIYPA